MTGDIEMTRHPALPGTMLSSAILALALSACAGGGVVAPTPSASGSTSLPTFDTGTVNTADPGSPLPEGWQYGGFMEIYVRGYKDSNGDGIGDLRGLTQQLDYLRDLGIKGIWLMPVTQSQDHDHGYAVTDYRDIETAYGSLADLDELVKQAHARGIGVIADYVMNHSGSAHPAFVNARASTGNTYRNWYVWQQGTPSGWNIWGNNPWFATSTGAYFAGFAEFMPDFNLRNADVVAWHKSNIRFWLNRGLDGLRFDAVGNLFENGPSAWQNQPENYALMNDIRTLASSYQRRYIVCEAPDDPRGFGAPTACGSAFAFGHQSDIVNAAKGDARAIAAVAAYFRTAPANMATFVSNHDSFAGARLWNQVGGNLAQYRLAAATYLLQPGIPFIYYGEEIGMAEAATASGDAALRTPMSWSADTATAGFTTGKPFRALSANVATQNAAAQKSAPHSLYAFYKAMLGLRNARTSIARGSYDAPFVSGSVMGFQRKAGSETTLVLINYGASAATVTAGGLAQNAVLHPLYPAGGADVAVDASGNAQVAVGAQSVLVFSLN
jgi:glycosidase